MGFIEFSINPMGFIGFSELLCMTSLWYNNVNIALVTRRYWKIYQRVVTNKAQVAKIKPQVREAHEWFYLPRVLYWSPQVDIFSNIFEWPVRHSHCSTIETSYTKVAKTNTHSGTLENKHMCLFSNVPLWVLVFATFVYDVSMVLQCECRTGHSKILENISTCGDQ